MAEKWITVKNKNKENRHVKLSGMKDSRPTLEMKLRYSDVNPSRKETLTLEQLARDQLKRASQATTVDQMLLHLEKYTGLLGDFSSFNSVLIKEQDPYATVVRSKSDWLAYGYKVEDDAVPINILFPVVSGKHASNGKILEFINKLRAQGLSDEMIDEKVREKYPNNRIPTHTFGITQVFDKKAVDPIPGKKQINVFDRDSEMKAQALYSYLKDVASSNYRVTEDPFAGGRGFTAQDPEQGQRINVMKIPGENVQALRTLLHELSHAKLEHVYGKGGSRGTQESEAELSAWLVGKHFGYDFKDSAPYIKGWSSHQDFKEDNVDRSMKTAAWIIKNVDLEELKGKSISGPSVTVTTSRKTIGKMKSFQATLG